MKDYQSELMLDYGEGVILADDEGSVYRYENGEEDYPDEIFLTTKNLICVSEAKKIETKKNIFSKIFTKSQREVLKKSIADIQIVNGKAQIMQVNHREYGIGMWVAYSDGTQSHFVFDDEREISKWIMAITQIIEGKSRSNFSADGVNASAMTEKRFCANCGAKVRPGAKFCSDCGTTI